jgi:diadenosine tetraphosphatase ApaH/serine/threonine PP2A family protein phosphatase
VSAVRIAVISDIHANLVALEAVLRELEHERPDAIWCLGDVVGYGPRPVECCSAVRDRADLCLVGNHDLGVLGSIPLADFTPEAAAVAEWTRDVLDEASRAFLASLTPSATSNGVELYHGSPRDPVWDYVLSTAAAADSFALTTAPLVLVGHSHLALNVAEDGAGLTGGLAAAGTTVDLSAGRRLLNPGSVGQPRDGDPRAAYLVLDLERRFAEFRRAPYSVEQTQRELRERGLPEALAERLEHGH